MKYKSFSNVRSSAETSEQHHFKKEKQLQLLFLEQEAYVYIVNILVSKTNY